MRLAGEKAVVTGSTSGIGRAIAVEFARQGATVVVTGRDRARGDAVVAEIAAAGGTSVFIAADLGDELATTDLVNAAAARMDGLTVLVNNAAGGDASDGSIGDLGTEAWEAILRVDLTAPMWCARAAIPHMQQAGHGAIVNMSSRQADRASRGLAAYVAAKAGLNGLTRAIAVDYASDGIRCNTISPGYVLNDRRDADISPERRARFEGMHLTRLGAAADVAHAAVYLASRESEFVTGINLQLDGGSSNAPRVDARLKDPPMHPRVCVSAISTFNLALDEDLAFWARHDIDTVGVSVAKLERFGWVEGTRLVADAVARGLRVANLIGLGPFHLADPKQWTKQQERLLHTLDTAVAVGAECMVFTTGPFAPLSWEEAADALELALQPVLEVARERKVPFAIEHTNSLRVDVGFVHTLRDAIDLARRLDTGVCMELNACWAERGLAATIRTGADRIRLVQVSDFKVGTIASSQRLVPGDGDMPITRILGHVIDAGYAGVFDLELIGAAITAEGYDAAVPRAVDALGAVLTGLGA